MNFGQFFILGNPRSGTSLLRLILNSHSALSVPPECGFLLWLYSKYKDWNLNCLENDTLFFFIDDLIASKKFETWNIEKKQILELIIESKPSNYEQLAHCVYLVYAKSTQKVPMFFGDKNNYYIHYLADLDRVYENKIIIHIVRDGRDVVTSYRGIKKLSESLKYLPQLTTDIEEIAKEWNDNNLNIYQHYQLNKNYIIIKYEDLLIDTISVLQKILNKFDLEFEKQMLSYYTDNKQNSVEPKETLAWKLKTLEPIDKSNIGKYKSELTEVEVDNFNLIANEALKIFGYDS